MSIDFSDFKVRCSSISAVLSNSRSNPCITPAQLKELEELEKKLLPTLKQQERITELHMKQKNSTKIILSDTCIAYLMDEYAWRTQKMVRITKEVMDVHQMRKGTEVEPESLKLLSMVDGVMYKENRDEQGYRQKVSNDFIIGEVDAYVGESIITSSVIPDIKSQWDYPTFLCKINESLTNANDWQIKGYMDISGAEQGFVANCLVTTPIHIQKSIYDKLYRKMNVISDEDPLFLENWAVIEHSMNFDHIPPHQRVFKKEVEPMDEEQRSILYDKVKVCREWLNEFHEMYQKLN